jgi:hypothetical protein
MVNIFRRRAGATMARRTLLIHSFTVWRAGNRFTPQLSPF